ncbi:carboxy terminal-processing peptidase [Sphingobacterium rhinopitheci]|uniref:carboxy terminal-processing peptidase n=1 Tax=Sphingobacterium rhinopitheci TaxID=2781960 RepID=UPI001F51727A|nr:carboxy terminal-processing peptidase [Sphingobacterium rhinopitheci]MCI0920646.1 carboxy terminal-processing peptidase [Sphingobacterium rhinopitheci]
MFRNLIVFLSLISFVACGSKPRVEIEDTPLNLTPTLQHEIIAKEIVNILENYSYKKVQAGDSLSNIVFNNLVKTVDQGKNYLIQEDIDAIEKFRPTVSQDLKKGDLSTPFYIFNLYSKRYLECLEYALTQVDAAHNFDIDENYVSYREKLDWFKSEEELKDQWRKRVKFDLLNLKLATAEGKNEDEKHKETLKKRYNNLISQAKKTNANDAFQLIMTSYTDAIDPHTTYYNPSFAQAFNEGMSNTLEGIGARLQMENEMVTIKEIIAGGPAFKDKTLKIDDRIIGVAQGKGEFEDIVGWRIDAAVAKIKGSKGTEVRLKILPAGQDISAQPTIVSLTREKIVIEEESAQKKVKIVKGEDGKDYKIGIITLPKFYIDFAAARNGDPNYKSTTRDVRLILDSLKAENVDGVLLDLRNNGGGSLQEAIELTGLFIDKGPVVQVRQVNNKVDIERDSEAGVKWDGPFGVIINRFSASASEIFAGAIQDYGRGIVLGSTTYGKGTVQSAIEMERFISPTNKLLIKASGEKKDADTPQGAPEFGQINVTIAKFYRVNGSSTQHKGVEADITFPTQFSAEKFGESSEKSALPWDQINTAQFNLVANLKDTNKILQEKHLKRMDGSEQYKFLLDDIKEFNKEDAAPQISLNQAQLKKERDANKEKNRARINKLLELHNMPLWKDGQPQPKIEFDFILDESLNVMADLIPLSKK